ncbi:hypothetical protein WJX73_005471 [Symbiochloris irregularis]|uniref:CHCH domain-containing protein n=1 Tax=Symbiochloris irregularis TaxID=706552 RepID=A0AAW1PWX7_9CHLO
MSTGGKSRPFKASTKPARGSKGAECGLELNNLFSCLERYSDLEFDAACVRERSALAECAAAANKKRGPKPTINHHLQRLYRTLQQGARAR